MKATYGEVLETVSDQGNPEQAVQVAVGRNIFKNPKTDSGTKKSAKGLLSVHGESGNFTLQQECTKEEEQQGCLVPVFEDGNILRRYSLKQIRQLLNTQL